MKTLKILFLFISVSMFSQEVDILESEIGKVYDFSQERQDKWIACDSLMYGPSREKQTPAERFVLEEKCYDLGYEEACDNIWSVICGNDWTDEGYNITSYSKQNPDYRFTTASSTLQEQCDDLYGSENIGDLNYETAWVEGVDGDGIGEHIEFNFPPSHPRITTVIIANGFVKSREIWKNNARVKQLKMYLNTKPFAILNVKDVYAVQTFNIQTIGKERNLGLSPDSIKFEISAVYKGDKYNDTAITEIYFDGLDVY